MFAGCCSRQDFLNFSWVVPPASYPEPRWEADAMLVERFPRHSASGVSLGCTLSQFWLSPCQSADPCRAQQRERSVKDKPSTWEGEGGADTDLACSTSWSMAADAPSSGSSCSAALQLLPSACCCLQPCQQISLCMCSFACSRHHQPLAQAPCSLPQLCRQHAGRAAAPRQEGVASTWRWDLLQEIQANILGHG